MRFHGEDTLGGERSHHHESAITASEHNEEHGCLPALHSDQHMWWDGVSLKSEVRDTASRSPESYSC